MIHDPEIVVAGYHFRCYQKTLPSVAGTTRHHSVLRGSSDRKFEFTFPLWCQKK